MKIKAIMGAGLACVALASCQGPQGSPLSEIDNATPGDSMMYYFGQIRGNEFKREAEKDTLLSTAAARKAYIDGVQAGIKAARGNDDAYNRGLFMGLQMAMNVNSFREDYDVKLDPKVFMEGMAESFSSDSISNDMTAQQEFHRLMNQFNEQKEIRDREKAALNLKADAAKQGLTEITPDLYGKAGEASDSLRIKEGDKLKFEIRIEDGQGKEIPAPFPKEMTVGQRMNKSPLSAAVMQLKSGETGTFLTTGQALFGPRCAQIRIAPSEVLTMIVTPTLIED